MKFQLFFCCYMALLASGNSIPKAYDNQIINANTTPVEYHSFQPSKVLKQKRKLRQRVSAWGWGVAVLALGLIVGIVWLTVWLWPMAAWVWRIGLGVVGLSLTVMLGTIGIFLFSYAYPTLRDMRFDALQRLEKLCEKIPMTATKGWCPPDEYFRISLAANADQLLVVDYLGDRAWLIPKNNIANTRSDFVALEATGANYPETPETAVVIARTPFENRTKRLPPPLPDQPMQVLQFQLRDLPLRQLTLVYQGTAFSDSTQRIAAELWP